MNQQTEVQTLFTESTKAMGGNEFKGAYVIARAYADTMRKSCTPLDCMTPNEFADWNEALRLLTQAENELLAQFKNYISTLKSCPKQMVDLFTGELFLKAISSPIQKQQLIDIVMKSKWDTI